MEKGLSQAQRDHLLMTTAKEDMHLKKDMLAAFELSNKTLDDSVSKMTTCLTSLGEGIAPGMRMLAMALTHLQTPALQFPMHNQITLHSITVMVDSIHPSL